MIQQTAFKKKKTFDKIRFVGVIMKEEKI